MTNQIPVLYTEQKTKKVKLWLDGYLVPRPTLNSARLISAGKHEIDVVFYSSIDDIQPGREFETDRYLISVEESNLNDQPCPRPSYAVNDPTTKNRPKSAGFVPPRLVPKPEPPPPLPTTMSSLERHNPNQWGYAGMTTAMKRSAYDDDNENHENYITKISKSSHFIPPTFQKREPIPSKRPIEPSIPLPNPQIQPGLINDSLMSRLLNNPRPQETKLSPIKQFPSISWSAWDEKKPDDEDTDSHPNNPNDNNLPDLTSTKQTYNWQSLVTSAGQFRHANSKIDTSETMPKFDFDDSSFDAIFDNLES
ncbi:unnamed protein product [Adineta ricciae]|uniref:5'-3' DNA helicase ZGRF1-like N-terminal domain-containing protein n=1 Tax=Adineta ricciae TaxID=249248 RepID=A0A814EBE7_ADIRI|nr:unnamed protein product [Adineta ricciae]